MINSRINKLEKQILNKRLDVLQGFVYFNGENFYYNGEKYNSLEAIEKKHVKKIAFIYEWPNKP